MVTIIRDALQDAGTNSIVNDSFENAKHVEYTEMETSELERSDYAFGLLILRSPAAQSVVHDPSSLSSPVNWLERQSLKPHS